MQMDIIILIYQHYNILKDYIGIIMEILVLCLREEQILNLFLIVHIKSKIQIK